MSLRQRLARWIGGEELKSITPASLNLELLAGARTSSGVHVNWKTALQASVAIACMRVIAEGLSQIPFRLMRYQGGRREPASNHPLYEVIEWSANEWQTSTDLVDQIGLHVVGLGNAYVWLNRSRGRITEMFAWPPNMVSAKLNGYAIEYEFTLHDGQRVKVPASDVWHIRGPSWDGWIGLDVISLARETIGLSLAAEKSVSAQVANGSRLSGILTTDATMTKEQRDLMRQSWQETYSGSQNAGRIAFLSNGMKFHAMQTSAVDAQQVENRKFAVEEVCRVFRVSPLMVGYSDKATTYASAEQMYQAHVVNTMGPWYRRIERSAAVALLTQQERAEGYYFKFFTQGLLRGSVRDRADYYTALYNVGAINPNEIRDLEDMNPYDGGEKYRVPLNMADPADEPDSQEQ